MQIFETTLEIGRPVGAVYDQWCRFQDFPQFMKAIKEVRRIDEKKLHWRAEIGGKTKGWDAEIVEQRPDERISWRSTSGTENSGTVTFISLNPAKTRVIFYISYDPKGLLENLGDNLGMVSAQVSADLNRFKAFVESRAVPDNTARLVAGPAPTSP